MKLAMQIMTGKINLDDVQCNESPTSKGSGLWLGILYLLRSIRISSLPLRQKINGCLHSHGSLNVTRCPIFISLITVSTSEP